MGRSKTVSRLKESSARHAAWLQVLLLACLLPGAGGILNGCRAAAARPSDHFDGRRFFNPGVERQAGFSEFLRWRLSRNAGQWVEWTDGPYGERPVRRVPEGTLRVTLVNHSTVLVQMDGANLLTDPIWSRRASPFRWIGPKRVRPPGLRFEDLPPIDAVLLSHDHYDHLDIPTLKRLAAEHRPRFVAGCGVEALLAGEGIPGAEPLDWWESTAGPVGAVTITAVPAQHFSGRGLADRNGTLWVGFVLRGPSGLVYFAGDTGFGPHFEQIRNRLGPPRLAMLPIGAYQPRWFMGQVHLSPDDAVRAFRVLGAAYGLGIHFGTFALADDGQQEPAEELQRALEQRCVEPARFIAPSFGEAWEVPAAEPPRKRELL